MVPGLSISGGHLSRWVSFLSATDVAYFIEIKSVRKNLPSKISLISVFLNEEKDLPNLIVSILAQSRLPDEIVLVDTGSTDGTVEILNEFKRTSPVTTKIFLLRDIDVPLGGNLISQGRNLAIQQSSYDLITCTDGGCILDKDWIANIIAPFEQNPSVDVVAGYYAPNPQSLFEEAQAAVAFKLPGELRSQKLPSSSLPSGRSLAFRKAAWKTVGGFPVNIYFSEDSVFFSQLYKAGYQFAFADKAIVYKRLSRTLANWFKKRYRYGRGEGLINRVPEVYVVRFVTYISGTIIFFIGFFHPLLWLALLAAGFSYLIPPYRRIRYFVTRKCGVFHKIRIAFLIPILLSTNDIAKMVGYVLGSLERLIGRSLFGHTVKYNV
jgi:cellulose synthase/poly-beta-1,6-N-acetylglucosamine synthase-like glycosyltransferase